VEEVQVHAARERLTPILTKLLTNAVKFTAVGSITVETDADENNVTIAVRDTGRGIPLGAPELYALAGLLGRSRLLHVGASPPQVVSGKLS
jgi:signal transduction histidine kinase